MRDATDSQTRSMGGAQGHAAQGVNVGDVERILSALGGAAVACTACAASALESRARGLAARCSIAA